MSKILLPAVMFFSLHASICHAQVISLFNGENLDGWDVYVEGDGVTPHDAWVVSEGAIRTTGRGKGYAVTCRAYSDYILQLDWRWPEGDADGRANSGILLHIVGPDKLWPKGFEAQLKSGRAGDFGSFEDARSDNEIVSRNPNGVSTGRLARELPGAEKPAGEWNHFKITARGGELILEVNGKELNRMTGVLPSAGHIALQSEGYPIEFRDIKLEFLPPAKDLHAPMPE